MKGWKTDYRCPDCGTIIVITRMRGYWCPDCREQFDKGVLDNEFRKGLEN